MTVLKALWLQCKIQIGLGIYQLRKIDIDCKKLKNEIKLFDLYKYCLNHPKELAYVKSWNTVNKELKELDEELNIIKKTV